MKKISLLPCLLALLLIFGAAPLAAQPNPSLPQSVKPLSFSPIVDQIQSLLTPAPSSIPAPTLSLIPLATATPAAPDQSDTGETETFGTKALNLAIAGCESLKTQGGVFISNFAALPQLSLWMNQQFSDPKNQDRWSAVGNDLLVTVGIPLIAAIALELLFLPLRRTITRRKPSSLAAHLAASFGLFIVRLLPLLVFLGASLGLLDQHEAAHFPRLVLLNVIYALALSRFIVAIIQGLFAPHSEAIRLLPLSTPQATYACWWLKGFSVVIIYGYFLIDLARVAHVPAAVISAFGNILGLVLVLMTLVVIAQKRAFVASALRGQLSAAQPDLTLVQSARLWFARQWHILAMIYLIIGYLIAALGVQNGFALMLRGTILTLLILAIARLAFHAIGRWGQRDVSAASAMHHAIMRYLVGLVIWIFVLIGVAAAWGTNIPRLFATPLGQRFLGASFSIGTTVIIVALIYEACSSAIEKRLYIKDHDGKQVQASARVRTLLPMIRNAIFILFSAIVAMVVLSEVGFNIGPLLAGARIFGVAVGFGSQTLVKDFLTGLSIAVENTVAIGDVVKIGDHSGVVEAMSVRTLRLRDAEGALHILPFSAVTTIINMTRDFSFAVIDVGVAYHSDLDHVMKVIRAVGEDMQKDPIFKRVILEPVEIFGVETLGDSSITIRSRVRTRPGKQWDVRRMFLLKIKQRFDKEGIEIPFPTVTNIQKPSSP